MDPFKRYSRYTTYETASDEMCRLSHIKLYQLYGRFQDFD